MKPSKLLLAHAMLAAAAMEIGGSPSYFNEKPKEWDSVVPKPCHRPLSEFSIKGVKIMAYSRKDAIKRYNHQKK